MVSSAPTNLWGRVRIPSTPSVLFSICIIEIAMRKRTKRNKKRKEVGVGPLKKKNTSWAESLCLVVMGGDSCFEVCGFESQHRILGGHFFTYIYSKNYSVCLKRRKIKGPG